MIVVVLTEPNRGVPVQPEVPGGGARTARNGLPEGLTCCDREPSDEHEGLDPDRRMHSGQPPTQHSGPFIHDPDNLDVSGGICRHDTGSGISDVTDRSVPSPERDHGPHDSGPARERAKMTNPSTCAPRRLRRAIEEEVTDLAAPA